MILLFYDHKRGWGVTVPQSDGISLGPCQQMSSANIWDCFSSDNLESKENQLYKDQCIKHL